MQEYSVDDKTTCNVLQEIIKEKTPKKRKTTANDDDDDNDNDDDDEDEDDDDDNDLEDDIDVDDEDEQEQHPKRQKVNTKSHETERRQSLRGMAAATLPRHKVLPSLNDAPFITTKVQGVEGDGKIYRRCLVTKTDHKPCDDCHLVQHYKRCCRCPHGKLKFVDCAICKPYYKNIPKYNQNYKSKSN